LFQKGPVQVFEVAVVEVQIGQRFAIEIQNFVVAKNDWCTEICQAAVGNSFDQQFNSDAIEIPCGKAHNRFLCFIAHASKLLGKNT
jgi:hypothetical protein